MSRITLCPSLLFFQALRLVCVEWLRVWSRKRYKPRGLVAMRLFPCLLPFGILSSKLTLQKRTDRAVEGLANIFSNSQDVIFLWHVFFPQSFRRRLRWSLYRLKGSCRHRMGVLHNRTQLFGVKRLMQAQCTS